MDLAVTEIASTMARPLFTTDMASAVLSVPRALELRLAVAGGS